MTQLFTILVWRVLQPPTVQPLCSFHLGISIEMVEKRMQQRTP
jgi:hypothetical protein